MIYEFVKGKNMKKLKLPKLSGVRKFITGESRYCQRCGKESFTLYEVDQNNGMKNKLQYCK